ncbi:MAG: alkyl sulfatase dimerization domain-containing protein [Sneathiella sp.]
MQARLKTTILSASLSAFLISCDSEPVSTDQATSASPHTQKFNQEVQEALPLDDQQDFQEAERGLIARDPDLHVKNAKGQTIWRPAQYAFVEGKAPPTVNPSLWRQAKLNNLHGLYQVADGLYQIRGYDLSNMSLIEGKSGWIVVDPLTTNETAAAALNFARKHLGNKPVSAVILTHSHVDHFGGILATLEGTSNIPIIAPKGFIEEATSENILAGPTMSRRAGYMYGKDLPKSVTGHVDTGLGKAPAFGSIGIAEPTVSIDKTPQEMTVDGVDFIFQYTPDSEAPAELTFYLPKYRAYCGAEIVSRNMHNLYTLRGAKVRDALNWSNQIEKSRRLFSEAEIYFGSHHWPIWGQPNIDTFMRKQRDIYKYIHDQTLRLAYKGYTPSEIAEQVTLPQSLSNTFANRGYYGTVSHNVKAVYQFYFGWFDGNPTHLNPHPRSSAASKYIAAMGGGAQVLALAEQAALEGDYRWSAELFNHLIFAGEELDKARERLAAVYSQLGYQAESGPWRDIYLSGAQELTSGKTESMIDLAAARQMLKHTPVENFFDAMAAQLNGPDAEGKDLKIGVHFTDLDKHYLLWLENAVLHHRASSSGKEPTNADLRITHDLFLDVVLKTADLKSLITSDDLKIDGSSLDLIRFFSLLDRVKEPFAIVEP